MAERHHETAVRQFGPYRLVEQIAVGGMAEIYLAKTRGIAGFEKYVALKMIHPNFSEDEQFIQMLIDEAKITVLLQHVNIAQTFDLGRVGTTYYITMEYVDGADLYKLLRSGSEKDLDVPVDVAAYITKEVATGLDYAHRKRDVSGKKLGIVHRDVSPQNVLISNNGEVKLVDFGIAKATSRARQTAVGVIKGKYYYMSPEQAWGEPVDHRTDIFSAGILLYEMLTGQMLYLEEDLHKLLDMVRKADIAPPSTLRRGVPPQLEKIVMRALAKERDDRYQTANDMATDLERFLHAYSPVFRATKVTQWLTQALGDEQSTASPVPDRFSEDESFRHSVTGEQLVRERSEITDENSVIFNVKDFRRGPTTQPPPPRSADDETGMLKNPLPSSIGFPGARLSRSASQDRPLPKLPSLGPRGLDQETKNVGADVDDLMQSGPADQEADDESTVISAAPLFGGAFGGQFGGADTTDENTPESTVIDQGFTGGRLGDATLAEHAVGGRDDATLAEHTRDDGATRAEPSTRRGPTGGMPKMPRRRGPTAPMAEPEPETIRRGATRSLDVAGPGVADDDPEDGPTLHQHKGAVPQANVTFTAPTVLAEDSTRSRTRERTAPPPAPPALSASNPEPAVSMTRTKRPSRRTPAGGLPAATPSVLAKLVQGGGPRSVAGMPVQVGSGTSPGGHGLPAPAPLPHGASAAVPSGFEHRGNDGTTTPYESSPHLRTPFGQLPPNAPPLSTANQLAALEVDDIPEAFKLSAQSSRKRRRVIIVGVALVACVLVGVGLGTFLFHREAPVPTSRVLEVVSIPTGAKVSVDGKPIDGLTPVKFPEASVGETYLIELTLEGYEPWSSETQVTPDGSGTVKVIARLEPALVVLHVDSQPSGAEVLVNRISRGTTPLDIENLDPSTATNVELRLKGYRPIYQTLDWDGATEKTLSFELKK